MDRHSPFPHWAPNTDSYMVQFYPKDPFKFPSHESNVRSVSPSPLARGSLLYPSLSSAPSSSVSRSPSPPRAPTIVTDTAASFRPQRPDLTLSGDQSDILESLSPLGQHALRYRASLERDRMIALQGQYYVEQPRSLSPFRCL